MQRASLTKNLTDARADRRQVLHSRAQLGLRLVAAIPGGYALSAAAVAALAGLLAQVGLTRSDAVVLSAMLGFVLYLVLLLWAFAVPSVARLWAVIAGGLAACCLLLWLMPMGA